MLFQMAIVVCILLSTVLISSTKAQTISDGDSDHPVVETSYGPVKGLKFVSSWTNQTIYAFRGIPYAAPPVGELRFKAPVAPEPWTSTLDCTADRAKCPQLALPGVGNDNWDLISTEDCLHVNVYSPEISGEPKPVMVWVHGGGFLVGSGNYASCGPDFLVAENVVVVTLNYRLGALGFLSLGTAGAPGNAGLRDQLLALRWVREEVRRFGGDPGHVTLFGESAGSASVHLLYISPLHGGLFQRVIGESGAGLAEWAVRVDGRPYALQLAALLNCSRTVETEACLRTADAQDIVNAQHRVQPEPEESSRGIQLAFIPAIDRNSSDDPLLPDFPMELYKQGIGSNATFLMGINSGEGLLSLSMSTVENVTDIRKNLEQFVPIAVRQTSSKAKIKELVDRISAFYFKEPVSSYESNLHGFVNLYTDVCFGYHTAVSARCFKNRNSVYLYYFTFNGAFKEEFNKYILKKFNITGVAHAEELSYIFIRRKVNQTTSDDSDEMKTLKRMTRMWTNFAKYGSPTKGVDPLLNVSWVPVTASDARYLRIDHDLKMSSEDFLAGPVALWDSISAVDVLSPVASLLEDEVGGSENKSEL